MTRCKSPDYLIERLDAKHNRAGFCSGADELDRYLIQQAGQDAKRHVAAPFVLFDSITKQVVGYYTLSAFSIVPCELKPEIAKKLPRYPLVPATLLGRLAVDSRFQGSGYGEILLLDALRRTMTHADDVATIGIVVEARDERAFAFYRRFDFQPFPNHEKRLFLSMSTIRPLFS